MTKAAKNRQEGITIKKQKPREQIASVINWQIVDTKLAIIRINILY